jgi:hypothetical protein
MSSVLGIRVINLQALLGLLFFIAALLVARAVMNIYRGRWPGGPGMLFYLRMLLGFLLAGAITLTFYSFLGKEILR